MTFATYFSTLTAGVLTLGLHCLAFLGGWIEQLGAITQTHRAVTVGVIASVLMPSEALWRRAAFEMQSPLANAMRISPFSSLSVPSTAMVLYSPFLRSAHPGTHIFRMSGLQSSASKVR